MKNKFHLALRWPMWVWGVIMMVLAAGVAIMAARTMRRGIGVLGTGSIRAAPVVRVRPGLMDSVRVLEYFLQQKKEGHDKGDK